MYKVLSILPVMVLALSVSSVNASSVPLEKVNTGNSSLDHQINTFYSCLLGTHKDPPSIIAVDQCFQNSIGGSVVVLTSHHSHINHHEGTMTQ